MILKIKIAFVLIFCFTSSELISQQINSVKHPEWSYNKVIYEVNIRQYTQEGTFKAFEDHLPRLKKLGAGILWLMPVNPIGEKNRKGTLGSYYAVKDYKTVNPAFGTAEEFKTLVDKIHSMGMYVIIDWVANHTAWDNVWVKEHPDFYTKDSSGNFVPPVADWADVIDLNYDNKELQAAMIDAMKYWIKEFDIDGYRCDVAGMVPVDFWIEVKKELDKIKPVFMLAEAWEPEAHKVFDMTYSWDIYHLMNNIAQGKKNAGDLKAQIEKEKGMYPKNAFRMQFTSNHDENSWNGTVRERLGNAAETFAAVTFLIPGMPLIYSGEEAGLNKRLEFFEKDPIEWKESKFGELYTKLCNLKKENDALLCGEEGGKLKYEGPPYNGDPTIIPAPGIFAFERENADDKIFAIFNLSNETKTLPASWYKLDKDYKDLSNDKEIETGEFHFDPWEYKIFYKN